MSGEDKTTQQNASTSQVQPFSPHVKNALDAGSANNAYWYDQIASNVPAGQFTIQGAKDLAGRAQSTMAANPFAGAMDNWSKTFGADGYNTAQRDSMAALMPTMRGDFLDLSQAPGYQQIRDKIQADAATEAMMSASMNGRGGSPYAQGLVGSKVADTLAGYDLNQYNTERDRQNSAINAMFGMGQTGMGNTSQAGSIWESLYGAQNAPAYELLAAGQVPNSFLEPMLGAAGAALPYGIQTGTSLGSTAQPSNTFGKIAGAGLGLASLFG